MEEPTQLERIRVCLRLRPVNKLEESRRSKNCLTTGNNSGDYYGGDAGGGEKVLVDSPLEGEFDFEFDKVS